MMEAIAWLIAICCILLTVAAFAFVRFAMARQEELHAEIVVHLQAERDFARNEARVYRNLLMPALKKAEGEPADRASQPEPPRTASPVAGHQARSASPAAERRRRQIVPFRKFFNDMRRMTNTPQRKTDALAEAIQTAQEIAAQKQETSHVR